MYAKNAWKKYSGEKLDALMAFNEEYKDYITKGKTERLCVKEAVKLAEDKGFKNIKEFKRVLDVNLVGTYLCSKYAAKMMLGAKKGKIINISSTNALDTYYPESCDYDASKAGVISLTHNMAREFAPFITVNCICPGWVKTQMNKDLSLEQINEEKKNILLGRFAEPEEIAKVVMFLSSSNASYINDSIIRVDGGKFNG